MSSYQEQHHKLNSKPDTQIHLVDCPYAVNLSVHIFLNLPSRSIGLLNIDLYNYLFIFDLLGKCLKHGPIK